MTWPRRLPLCRALMLLPLLLLAQAAAASTVDAAADCLAEDEMCNDPSSCPTQCCSSSSELRVSGSTVYCLDSSEASGDDSSGVEVSIASSGSIEPETTEHSPANASSPAPDPLSNRSNSSGGATVVHSYTMPDPAPATMGLTAVILIILGAVALIVALAAGIMYRRKPKNRRQSSDQPCNYLGGSPGTLPLVKRECSGSDPTWLGRVSPFARSGGIRLDSPGTLRPSLQESMEFRPEPRGSLVAVSFIEREGLHAKASDREVAM